VFIPLRAHHRRAGDKMKVMAAAHDAPGARRHPSSFDYNAIHHGTWALPRTVKPYERSSGWADPGERVALKYVAVETRCRPILDIGVGTGRTTALLRAISRDYIGIDDNAHMVEICRAQHPDAQISRMDPRNLARFDDNQFALVVFSSNGIDAVSRSDRRRILLETARVLQPNGLFVFCAHNREATPLEDLPALSALDPLPSQRHWPRVRSLLNSVRHYLPQRMLGEPEEDASGFHCDARVLAALGTYATLAEQKRQLRDAGLQTELVLDHLVGRPVEDGADTSAFAWLHYVARKV
jgi:SAM-dependent methyltransferase